MVLSTSKGFAVNSFLNSSTTRSATPSDSRNFMMILFPSVNSWIELPRNPFFSRVERAASIDTGFVKLSWTVVPPAKSMPRFAFPRPIWIRATSPRRISSP